MRIRVIQDHEQGCCAAHSWPKNPWALLGTSPSEYWIERYPVDWLDILRRGYFYGDSIGRRTPHGNCRWLTAICNSMQCGGLLIVLEDDLLAIVQNELARRSRGAP